MADNIQIKGISGGVDRRGLCSWGQKYLFQNMTPEQAATTLEIPNMPGLPIVGRQFNEWDVDNFSFFMTITFEGLSSSGSSQPGQDQYLIDDEWREEPIEQFPDRDLLIKEYGAYIDPEDGRLKFPQYLTSGSSSGSGFGSKST